jgi:hypothetical protein
MWPANSKVGIPLLLTFFLLTVAQVTNTHVHPHVSLCHWSDGVLFHTYMLHVHSHIRHVQAHFVTRAACMPCMFSQELPATALGLLLARDLHLSPSDSSSFYAATYVPWTIKPVYGFISDNIAIYGWRRRPWLCLCCVGAMCACIMQSVLGTTQETILGYSIVSRSAMM